MFHFHTPCITWQAGGKQPCMLYLQNRGVVGFTRRRRWLRRHRQDLTRPSLPPQEPPPPPPDNHQLLAAQLQSGKSKCCLPVLCYAMFSHCKCTCLTTALHFTLDVQGTGQQSHLPLEKSNCLPSNAFSVCFLCGALDPTFGVTITCADVLPAS